jgi:hypothetical protein
VASPPRFVAHLIGKRFPIPNPETPTVSGWPIYLWESSPMLWQLSPKPAADE